MNPRPRLRFSALLAFASLLAACSTSPMSRIDANRAVYESWPIEMQQAALSGHAIQGMTPEMVEITLGKPTEISRRSGKDGEDEIWIYRKSSGLGMPSILNNTNISVGGGLGGIGVNSGIPIGGRNRSAAAAADEQEVVFRNGVVYRADASP